MSEDYKDKYTAKMNNGYQSYYHKYWEVEVKANSLNALQEVVNALNFVRTREKDDDKR